MLCLLTPTSSVMQLEKCQHCSTGTRQVVYPLAILQFAFLQVLGDMDSETFLEAGVHALQQNKQRSQWASLTISRSSTP